MSHFLNPDRARFQRFKDLPRDEPVHMLNLVKFREIAAYEDGTVATGREAYAAYSRKTTPILKALGGRIVWSGQPQCMLIGPEPSTGEDWDIAFIAEYPSGQAFIDMIRNPEYQKAAMHRTAAVADSRLIRMKPKEAGGGFG